MIVSVLAPRAAVLLAATLRTPADEIDAVTPLGCPDTEKLTLPVNPFSGLTEIVLVPLAPCATVKLVGEAERLKSGDGAGVSVY